MKHMKWNIKKNINLHKILNLFYLLVFYFLFKSFGFNENSEKIFFGILYVFFASTLLLKSGNYLYIFFNVFLSFYFIYYDLYSFSYLFF